MQHKQDKSTKYINDVREQKSIVRYNIDRLNSSIVEHSNARDDAIIAQYVGAAALRAWAHKDGWRLLVFALLEVTGIARSRSFIVECLPPMSCEWEFSMTTLKAYEGGDCRHDSLQVGACADGRPRA